MEQWYVVIALLLAAIVMVARLRKRSVRPVHVAGRVRSTTTTRRAVRRRSAPASNDLAVFAYWTSATIAMIVTQARHIKVASRDGWQHHLHQPEAPLMSHPVGAPSEKPALEAAETLRNAPETVETPAETVDQGDRRAPIGLTWEQAAKLVRAKKISETALLEVGFDVKAGGGKEYQALRAQLKAALEGLESPTLDGAATTVADTTTQRLRTTPTA